MNCCTKCFEAKFLIEQIEKDRQGGDHAIFAVQKGLQIVAAHDLGGYFNGLVNLYEAADDGNHMFVI